MSILLTNEWTKQSMARAVDGAYYERGKGWCVDSPDARTAAVICTLFPELQQAHPELTALRDTLLGDSRPFDNATPFDTRIKAPLVEAQLAAEGFSLHDYQAIDLGYVKAVLQKHRAAIIAWQFGLGKTLAACALIDSLVAQHTLVLCPNVAKVPVWKAEINRWLPGVRVYVMPNGDPTKREKLVEMLQNDDYGPLILICHYEALPLIADTRSAGKGWQRLGEWDLVVADEAHRLANPKTKQHRALMKVPTSMKLALTGSLVRDKPGDEYGVLRWLFPKVYKSRWRDWNNRFLDHVEGGYGKVLVGYKPDAIDTMRAELGVFTVMRRSSDELDLPPRIDRELVVDLSSAQRSAYNTLRDECIVKLDSGETIVGLMPITMFTRLRQIASGMSAVSDKMDDSSKLNLAEELVEEAAPDGVVVYAWHKSIAKAMAARLGDEAVLLTGDNSQRQRSMALDEFNSGAKRVLCATLSVANESLNLQAASNVIFVEQSWSPSVNAQATARVERQGQTKTVYATRIVARDTVDTLRQLPRLEEKAQMRRALMGAE